jgi:conjugative transposon TraM protein
MEVFKKQMSYVDSMTRAGDPEYKAEQMRLKAIEKAEKEMANKPKLAVVKADATPKVFNTVRIKEKESFVKAIIDENVKGYAGSRIRLRLLEDITVGGHLVKRGTYIYAQISSFSEQRVGLSIISIIKENKIFPVRLEVYDLDGMPGLYVPASEFREFSKQLGGNSIQGVNLGSDPQNTSQFMMSAVQKMFTSTSQAIASLIRKNKAKLKYNTYIYLIDPQELQNQQSNY